MAEKDWTYWHAKIGDIRQAVVRNTRADVAYNLNEDFDEDGLSWTQPTELVDPGPLVSKLATEIVEAIRAHKPKIGYAAFEDVRVGDRITAASAQADEDVPALFDEVKVGDRVILHGDPDPACDVLWEVRNIIFTGLADVTGVGLVSRGNFKRESLEGVPVANPRQACHGTLDRPEWERLHPTYAKCRGFRA